MKKFKITKGNRVYIVDAKSHIDAISKVKAVKTDEMRDSISQWNPGMSEIGLFQISYKRNGVYQSILVRANSEEQAKQKLLNNLNGVDIIGVNSHPSPHFHEPILDSSIKDDGYYYLLRDAIDLLTKPGAARSWSQPYLEEVQEYMVQKGINPTNVNQWKKKYESLTMDSSIKDEWSGIRSNGVIFNYSNGKYTITHKNGKVETFPDNKFNTVEELFKYIDNIKDSAVKDMPLMFKSNVNMQSLKSNIDNVKNKPNETYINSLNANIQGIIADIEEIKGYEKEGKFNESPALKFSCKNLMAQYYKLLNDPKLQGTLHKLDVPTYKNVLYAEHQAQMLSQVTLKDSAIKDYSPEVYINELKKLIPEYEKMRDLRTKIISYLTERNFTKYDDVERDVRIKQYIKQVRELNNKWNRILENLDRFPIQQFKQESNTSSDRDIWFSGSPNQGTIRAIQREIEAKNNK